ncbi:hypothetical protein H8356DRAFT_1418110 [Neocallimastix lanati (nom. inval.)]|nr:hypothetical protein H8356DRAFT_1418110 [Neocallimastix sp. JGI-2020a]
MAIEDNLLNPTSSVDPIGISTYYIIIENIVIFTLISSITSISFNSLKNNGMTDDKLIPYYYNNKGCKNQETYKVYGNTETTEDVKIKVINRKPIAHYVNLRKTNKTDQNDQDCKIEGTYNGYFYDYEYFLD